MRRERDIRHPRGEARAAGAHEGVARGARRGRQARAADAVAAHGLGFLQLGRGRIVVSAFSPMPDEFRVWPLLRRLHGEGLRAGPAGDAGQGQAADLPRLGAGRRHGQGRVGHRRAQGRQAGAGARYPDRAAAGLRRRGLAARLWRRLLRPHAAAACARARPSSPSASPTTSRQVDAVPHLDYDQRLDWVLRPSGPLKCAS